MLNILRVKRSEGLLGAELVVVLSWLVAAVDVYDDRSSFNDFLKCLRCELRGELHQYGVRCEVKCGLGLFCVTRKLCLKLSFNCPSAEMGLTAEYSVLHVLWDFIGRSAVSMTIVPMYYSTVSSCRLSWSTSLT